MTRYEASQDTYVRSERTYVQQNIACFAGLVAAPVLFYCPGNRVGRPIAHSTKCDFCVAPPRSCLGADKGGYELVDDYLLATTIV
jgi:hypothetical protein